MISGKCFTEDPARDGSNWYAYVNNNPLRYTDPTGMYDLRIPGASILESTTGILTPTVQTSKMSYPAAGLPSVGPCTYRALMAIAETRTGNFLTKEQIQQGVAYLRASNVLNTWEVKSQEKVVSYGLDKLGSDEKATWIGRSLNFDQNKKIPEGAEASLVKTNQNIYGFEHFGEGDKDGTLVWDGLGKDTITTVNRVDFFKFEKKEEE